MGYAVRLDSEYAWVVDCHIREGESIKPGAPLVDVMLPSGVVETLTSDCWGIVAHIEGNAAAWFDSDDDVDEDSLTGKKKKKRGEEGKGGWSSLCVYYEGDVLCHIAKRADRNNRDGKLHPRPAVWIRLAREAGLRP